MLKKKKKWYWLIYWSTLSMQLNIIRFYKCYNIYFIKHTVVKYLINVSFSNQKQSTAYWQIFWSLKSWLLSVYASLLHIITESSSPQAVGFDPYSTFVSTWKTGHGYLNILPIVFHMWWHLYVCFPLA